MARPPAVHIDDLSEPRFCAEAEALRTGLPEFAESLPLLPDFLMDAARAQTSLDDFGDSWFREPLGVLCTASGPDAQGAMLRELRRVLRPSGRAGLLVFLATRDRLDNPPSGNHFPSRAQLTALLLEAGLTETAAVDPASLLAPSACWRERTAAVDDELRRRFGDAPQLVTAMEQSHRIGQLLRSGELVSQVIRLHRPA